jgi:hypothetical protein
MTISEINDNYNNGSITLAEANELRKTAEQDFESPKDKRETEDLAYANHLNEVKRIKKKYPTEMNENELRLFKLWQTYESNQSLVVIKNWMIFFGVLSVLGLFVGVISVLNIVLELQ